MAHEETQQSTKLAGVQFSLEGSGFGAKEKQHLTSLIKDQGGSLSYILTKKVRHFNL